MYRVFICYVYDNFIEIFSGQHIGCIYAKYVERFTDSYTGIMKRNTCKHLQILKMATLT